MTEPRVQVPDMCQRHQARLCQAAGYGPEDPWRALIIVAQIVLFQSAAADPATHRRLGGEIANISKLGCLACYNPEAFNAVVAAAKTRDLGAIKRLGEQWVREAET